MSKIYFISSTEVNMQKTIKFNWKLPKNNKSEKSKLILLQIWTSTDNM